MTRNIARAMFLIALLLLLAAGCATRGPVITERNLPPEKPDATPPPSTETDAPTAADEQALASMLNKEAGKPHAGQNKPAPQDKNHDRHAKPATEPPRNVDEQPLNESTAPEPESRPEPAPVAPPTRTAPPRQGQFGGPDPALLNQALSEHGAPRARAALALTREGRQLMAEGNAGLAETRFEKALSVDASNGQALLGLAELRYGQEKWQQAAAMATKAALHLGKQPYFLSRAHLVAARALVNSDRSDAAYQQVLKAVAADPENEEARLLKITLEASLGISPQNQ